MLDRSCLFRTGAALVLVGLAVAAAPRTAHAQSADACAGLKASGLFKDTVIDSAMVVPADAARKLPAYCEVKGFSHPVPRSDIGVVYRLPEGWNGKLLGIGGGGSAGNVRLDPVAIDGLRKGYATAQTDGGHPDPDGSHVDWAVASKGKPDMVKVADFGNRAMHVMTLIGKDVVAKYYGKAQSKTYYQGCSTGGREGLMEVQRYPTDYDAVITGAPVYTLQTNTTAMFRTQFFHKDPESNLLFEQLPTIAKAITKACDKLDGVEDGILADPRQCKWMPDELKCKPGEKPSATCLSAKQVATVRNMYAGVKTKAGVVAAYGILRGSEESWGPRSISAPNDPMGSNMSTGSHTVMYMVYGDGDFDVLHYSPERVVEVENSPTAKVYESKNPDASAFLKRGGKWIMWQGFNDPGPSPLNTIGYYEQAKRVSGAKLGKTPAQMNDQMRLFLATGVYHCGGGPGPDQFDLLTALDNWVQNGTAPERIVATKRNSPISRPLCPYPALPHYTGTGDTNDEKNFVCKAG